MGKLVECKACKNKISVNATSCPNCGEPSIPKECDMAPEVDGIGKGPTASSSTPEQLGKKEHLASLMATMEAAGVNVDALMPGEKVQAVMQEIMTFAKTRKKTRGSSALDRIFSAAGLANMDVSEAAFIVMMMTTKDMDDDIRLILAEIKAMTQAKQRLREFIKDLNQWISREMSKHPNSKNIDLEKVTGRSPNEKFKVSSQMVMYKAPQPDIEEVDLVAEYTTVYDLSGGGGVTIQGLRSLLDDIKGKLDGMNEMSEMTSLRLQMTMDRRSKFISTLSQIMKKISTTQDTLVQNIK